MNSYRPAGVVLVGLALVAAVAVTLQPKTSAPPSHLAPKDKAAEVAKALLAESAAPAARVPEGPLKPVYGFLGPDVPLPRHPRQATGFAIKTARYKITGELTHPEGGEGSLLDEWPKEKTHLQGYRFQFLIACVPDPVDSGFGYKFDQVLEALQAALDEARFVIDRAWLPWRLPAGGNAPPRTRWQDRYPGLVLFRSVPEAKAEGDSCRKDLLALLLVGETPTAGIHKTAFAKAVQILRKCPADKVEGNRVRVIGPFFSGSVDSLRMALEKVRETEKKYPSPGEPLIKVVNGSASAFPKGRFLGEWQDNVKAGNEPPFEETILPDELVLKHLWKYLGRPENPEGKDRLSIVLLLEANTAFGAEIDTITQERGKKGTDTSKHKKGEPYDFIRAPFPFHISQLRSAYTREQLARLESQGLPRGGRNLPFPVEGDATEKGAAGVLQAQAPLMTAATNDLVLHNLVTTLAQNQARRVGLVSTDPQDTIFLARVIRDRYPDVQLFTVGNDLLYTHEDFTYELRGMVVAGTYSLSPRFQRWSDLTGTASPQRIHFSNEGFQGYYNAALVQLARAAPYRKGGRDRQAILGELLDYGWEPVDKSTEDPASCPDHFTLPPIWINVVGTNGQLIPVKYIPPRDYLPKNGDLLRYVFHREWPSEADGDKARFPDFGSVSFPGLLVLLFLLLLTGNGYLFYYAFRYAQDSRWNNSVRELAGWYKQRMDFGVVCLAQVLLYGQTALLALTPLRAGHFASALPALLVLVVSLGMLAASAGLYVQVVRRPLWGWRRLLEQWCFLARESSPIRGLPQWLGWLGRGGLWMILGALAMALVLALTLICFAWRIGAAVAKGIDADEVLWFERLVHLNNGVTPVLPRLLFCAALFAWGFFFVKKLFLANRCQVRSPFPPEPPATQEPHPLEGLRAMDEQVRSELMPPSTLRRHFWECFALFAFVGYTFIKFWGDSVPPVDGVWHGRVTLFGFSLGALVLLFTLVQFYFAGRGVRRLLRSLALLPMQSAFQRLGDKVVSVFGGDLFSLRPRHSRLIVSAHQYRRMERLFPPFHAALQQAAGGFPAAIGPLDAPAVHAAWDDVHDQFPNGQLEPDVAAAFEHEDQLAGEDDLEPPLPGHTWGGQTGEACSLLARRCLLVLRHFWPVHTMGEAFGQPMQTETQAAPTYLSLPEGHPVREWAVAAEDFCALEITRYLSQFVIQLRTLLTSLTVGSLLLLLAAAVYPFFPQSQLLVALTALGAVTAAAIVTFLVQLNRDELVSRINRSTPNRFTPDLAFVWGAGKYVLPIVAAFMIQFPTVTSTLRSLLDPLLHVLR
jgi:hypothetical protein